MASPRFRTFNSFWASSTVFASSPRSSFRPLTRLPRNQQLSWQFSQKRTAYNRGFNYQRFQKSSGLLKRWAARPTFYYEVGGIGTVGGGFYIYNLEEVPVSHRRRFNVVSEDYEQTSGQELYKQVMSQYSGQILSPLHPQHRMVQKVLDRLIPHSGLSEEKNRWEVHVIQDPQKNAFVIPGGKVFVFSGILDVCQGEDGLAAVLGHEIAHNVAHHAAERMSSTVMILPVAVIAGLFLGLPDVFPQMAVDLAFLKPGSRAQESEADYIGLMMMAEACFDPHAAVGLWSRMEKEEQSAPPQFLSTHPSSHNRMEKIREWLPEAEVKQQEGGCGMTANHASHFQDAFGVRW
ncbi:hypothetical protein AAFC00_003969 [Neodothiora populina]|uniref:Peptidase M48 domain-containing protein n=1 Tax=Neodothiora populina TaxID=2781224 RepID=A0ABR3PI29_9PEZI